MPQLCDGSLKMRTDPLQWLLRADAMFDISSKTVIFLIVFRATELIKQKFGKSKDAILGYHVQAKNI